MEGALKRVAGSILLEQVFAIGLLGFCLIMIAAVTLQTGRGSKNARLNYEAGNIVDAHIETYQGQSVSLLDLGTQPEITGELSSGVPYQMETELYDIRTTLGTPWNDSDLGLTASDIKGIRVTMTWSDSNGGSHKKQAEAVLVKIAR